MVATAAGSPGQQSRTAIPLRLLLALVCGLGLYLAWIAWRAQTDPGLFVLTGRSGADWIIFDEPADLAPHPTGTIAAQFRTTFTFTPGQTPKLRLRAFRHFNVLLDGTAIAVPDYEPNRWKEEREVAIPPTLAPGRHVLTILVANDGAPAALWARCDALSLHSASTWETSIDGVHWRPARSAAQRVLAGITFAFPSPAEALRKHGLFFGVLFTGAATLVLLVRSRRTAPGMGAANFRWALFAVWVTLAANNMFKLPAVAGFDVAGHFEYIAYLLNNHRIPYANEGWQLFQSPLAYALGAALFFIASKLTTAHAVLLVRLIPLTCGLLQIELSYRACRRLFPQNQWLQFAGAAFTALLPMNLYVSQYFGNEPLASVLAAAVFLLCLRVVKPDQNGDDRGTVVWLGLLLGLALLAKVSAALMIIPVLMAFACRAFGDREKPAHPLRHFARTAALTLGLAFVLAGWYYIRNWVHLGRPFIGGWDASRGITWWQEPGFRTASQYLSFGVALVHPIYAGLSSFWDGVYASFWCDSYLSSHMVAEGSVQWNYDFMAAGIWFALVPTTALLIGTGWAILRVIRHADSVWLVTIVTVLVYAVALLHHSLTLPAHCSVKAFYTLSATPAYAVLFAAGLAAVARWKPVIVITTALITCSLVCNAITYFVHG